MAQEPKELVAIDQSAAMEPDKDGQLAYFVIRPHDVKPATLVFAIHDVCRYILDRRIGDIFRSSHRKRRCCGKCHGEYHPAKRILRTGISSEFF